MEPELTIRPARPDDRAAMEHICAHTWEGGDYLPEVWDEWLADEKGLVIVGEVGGQVVVLNRITWQAPDQVWLEGMRVDPDFRRQGIAARFLDYDLTYAREHGARVVRLSTGRDNTAVHILMGRVGMERIGGFMFWIAEPLPGGPQPKFLTIADEAQVRAFLADSPVLAYTRGLYSPDWNWQELSAAHVRQFLEEGRAVGQFTEDGRLAALAMAHLYVEDNALWVDLVDGTAAAIEELAMAIRAHAANLGAAKVYVKLIDLDWLREAFRRAGYGFGEWQGELWIFERWLAPRGGGERGD